MGRQLPTTITMLIRKNNKVEYKDYGVFNHLVYMARGIRQIEPKLVLNETIWRILKLIFGFYLRIRCEMTPLFRKVILFYRIYKANIFNH